jgi:hypothetical protein
VDLMSNALIGIIAEDESDVDCVKYFVRRMHAGKRIGFKKFVGQGCGKINRKANAWAKMFKLQGCNAIILLHDLDRNDKKQLKDKIEAAFLPVAISKYLICIPVEELEAWLMSDEYAFNEVFDIRRNNYLPLHPETIPSPKERIGAIVSRCTNKRVDYINTKHNAKLAEKIDIEKINTKCDSFKPFKKFVADLYKKA